MADWNLDLRTLGYVVEDGASPADVGPHLGRTGESSILSPHEPTIADQWSLSGTYGLDRFPWHTDGAVSSHPPRWLILRGVSVSEPTATELLEPGPDLLGLLRQTVLRTQDRIGRVRHLPAVVPTEFGHRLRWDPRICTPRSGASVPEVETHEPTAVLSWKPGRLAVFDNARLLHRRPAVVKGPGRQLERTFVWED
jgi:L-asparagine oxygenase